MTSVRSRRTGSWVASAMLVCFAAAGLSAQLDPSQMSGIPRPDPNLPDGVITVRVLRGSFANNVVEHPVELRAGDMVSTVDTDAEGRATFSSPRAGSQVQVATSLDGERLESDLFQAPDRGGVAVMLVGVVPGGDPSAAPVARPGRVTFGQDSRILIELGEENIEVYYLLDVLNVADAPVEPETPFEFRLPSGAQAGTVLQGSTPRTIIDGPEVSVSGAFAPGLTPVRVAYILPYSSGSLVLSQTFSADFDQLLVFVEKWGAMDVASRLIDRRGEMPADASGGSPLLRAEGARVAAGLPVELELSGLPHHSGWPRTVALSLSSLIVALGLWGASGTGGSDTETQRIEVLQARREKLFADLVKTERQHRQGKMGATRYGTRRAELFSQLERVLRDLDEGLAPGTIGTGESTPRVSTA
ncbi:MAG: hypothetical protein QF681_15570 [Vicinamibacterales bacterium]|nr:hypothetical protein [Vicinamibacterales bacterium]